MTNLLRFLLVLVFTAVSGQVLAQGTSGAVVGSVVDDKNEPVISAVVQAYQGGILKGGAATDFDGNFVIKPLAPGRYDLTVKYIGYKESKTVGVIVSVDQNTEVKTKLQPSTTLDEVVIIDYKVPLINKYEGGSTTTKTSDQLEQMATRNTTTMVSTSAGAYSQTDGGAVSIGGGRADGTLYIIDGVQVYGSRGINVSQGSIDQIQVITSGIPAKYGDAIGGVVTITTKGVSEKLRGSVLLEKSVDGYGHNLGNFTLSGPLLRKYTDSTHTNKKPIVGFFLAGDAWYDKDRSPEYHGNYAVKDEVLQNLRDNPLIGVPNQSGVPVFRNRAETVTGKDLYLTKAKQNAQVFEGRLTGRLDFQLSDELNLSAGGTFNYSKSKIYNRSWSYFSIDEIPDEYNYTGRGFIRLQQSFKKKNNLTNANGEEKQEKSLISNAFYTLQVDYQTDYRKIEDPNHKKNVFNYGYVGKFNTEYTPI
ncbi:MAG: carboxypeptidase-like regulatory domain-containing protein, partial [Chitinophagaceae bacterium]|nr:carboxypeptidase-like regulatory domain-containing protein [Chitinophagaceae bacterium]